MIAVATNEFRIFGLRTGLLWRKRFQILDDGTLRRKIRRKNEDDGEEGVANDETQGMA